MHTGSHNWYATEDYGTLYVPCPACNGRRSMFCLICGGTGKDRDGQPCKHCGGDGKIRCITCDGLGEVRCAQYGSERSR